MKQFFFMLGILLSFASCDNFYGLWIFNNTNNAIYFYSNAEPQNTVVRDTSINFSNDNTYYFALIQPKTKHYDDWGQCDPERYVRLKIPHDTLSIFFFDKDTIERYSWEEIRSEYKILCRYDVSAQDIKRHNYTFSYPPDESMKDIKMYPPYGANIINTTYK